MSSVSGIYYRNGMRNFLFDSTDANLLVINATSAYLVEFVNDCQDRILNMTQNQAIRLAILLFDDNTFLKTMDYVALANELLNGNQRYVTNFIILAAACSHQSLI